jgi:hypothetical protein
VSVTVNPRAEILRQQMPGAIAADTPVLLNHPAQSTTTIDRWASIFFGLLFLPCGAFIIAVALQLIPGKKNAPNALIGLIGSFFFLGGLFFVVHGIHGLIRRALYQRQIAAQPAQPWLADYHWHREGSSFSAFQAMVSRLAAAIFWYAFLVPFFWVGITQPGTRVFLFGAGLFALVGLFFWVRWAKMMRDFLHHGNSFLVFDSFPYIPCRPFQARLRAPRHLDSIEELTVTLRCVQEKYVERGFGNNRSTEVVCFELYRDVATFNHEQLVGAAHSYLPISFRLPDNQPTNHLADTPPTYWEIEARGGDYEAYFLIPVYRTV